MSIPPVDNKALIRCVKNYPALYMASHPKYTDGRFKEEIWEKIACALGIPVSLSKRCWFNLRDSFRRTLRKRRDSIVDGLPYRKWRFEDEMEFMTVHICIREPHDKAGTNLSLHNEFENCDPLDVEFKATNGSFETEKPPKPKRKRNKAPASESTTAASTPQPDCSYNSRLQLDHIDAFLIGIGATLKNFTSRNQSLAKAKIFAMVSEMEIQQIQEFKEQAKTSAEDRSGNGDEEAADAEEYCDVPSPDVYMDDKEDTSKQDESNKGDTSKQSESDNEDISILPESDKEGGTILPESDKEGGSILPESDKEGGSILPETDKEGGNILPESDKKETNAQQESDKEDTNKQQESDQDDGSKSEDEASEH